MFPPCVGKAVKGYLGYCAVATGFEHVRSGGGGAV